MTPASARPIPGQELATAVPVFGLGLLIFNDAIIKNTWPGLISGKLSDFAIVLYFPFLLTASWSVASAALRALARPLIGARAGVAPGLTRTRLVITMALTAFALSAINVSTRARDIYLQLLDRLDVFNLMPAFGYTVDPTDLVGLLCLPVTWWWGNRLIRARAAVAA
jgi:hypothetical protein